MALLGIDIGSTNYKCVAIEPTGKMLGCKKMPARLYSKSPDGRDYINGNRLFHDLAKLCGDTLDDIGQGFRIDGLAVAGIGSSGILLDQYGKQIPVTPLDIIDKEPMPWLSDVEYKNTCGYPRSYRSVGQMTACFLSEQAMRTERECNVEQHNAAFTYFSVADYINYRLTGIKKRELSTASSITPLKRENGDDWAEFWAHYQIDSRILPPLCRSGDFLGEVTEASMSEAAEAAEAADGANRVDGANGANRADGANGANGADGDGRCIWTRGTLAGFPVGAPVFAGGHDYLCAALAIGCIHNGDIFDVLGTYEMLAILSDNPFGAPDYQGIAPSGALDCIGHPTFMDRHITANLHAITTEMPSSAKFNDYFNETEMSDIGLLFSELDSISDTTDCSPVRNARAASLAEAIESINMASSAMFERLEKKAHVRELSAKVTGGGSASRFWLRNKADITGWTLVVPRVHESAATGAALVAGVGCGAYASLEAAAHVYDAVDTTVYKPDPAMHEYYQKRKKLIAE